MNIDLWHEIGELIDNGRLDSAIRRLEACLASCECDRFKSLLQNDLTNSPITVADHIDRFIAYCEESDPIEAIYLEMNGFDINVDRWYFDSFGYRRYIDTPDALEWLPYWDFEWAAGPFETIDLTGLEELQSDYDWYSNKQGHEDSIARTAADIATPLVMCRFARLIERAIATRKIEKHLWILASAHDFDIIPKFRS